MEIARNAERAGKLQALRCCMALDTGKEPLWNRKEGKQCYCMPQQPQRTRQATIAIPLPHVPVREKITDIS